MLLEVIEDGVGDGAEDAVVNVQLLGDPVDVQYAVPVVMIIRNMNTIAVTVCTRIHIHVCICLIAHVD
jgi:hypothetical protein